MDDEDDEPGNAGEKRGRRDEEDEVCLFLLAFSFGISGLIWFRRSFLLG